MVALRVLSHRVFSRVNERSVGFGKITEESLEIGVLVVLD